MTEARAPSRRAAERPVTGRMLREGGELARWIGSLRLAEFVLFALMLADLSYLVSFPGGRASELFLGLLVVLALLRRPERSLGRLQRLVPVVGVALVYLAMVSLAVPPEDGSADWRLRLVRLGAVAALVFVLASGRIDLRSGIAGMALVCLVNVPVFYAGLAPDSYGGYLTGLIGDKNFAGYTYAVVGVLTMALVRRAPLRLLVFLVFAPPLWLTGSRTALAGYALAAVWILLGPRLQLLGKLALGALSYLVVEVTTEDYSRIGRFSDREGSDLLRARIDAASEIKVEETGPFGRGLGSAFVEIPPDLWFFHNSYWTALVEGGWPWLLVVLTLTLVALLHPLRRRTAPALPLSLGLGVVILVTAGRMGEVFFTLPWAIAVGYGLACLVRARDGVEHPEWLRASEAEPAGAPERGLPPRRPGNPKVTP